jgi:hyaluronan synthase
MLAFLLQLSAWSSNGKVYLFALFMIVVWLIWAVKVALVRYYRPVTEPYEVSTAVVIPVVDEPPELFRSVVDRIREQDPSDLVVVINGRRNLPIEEVCIDLGVRYRWIETPGKRHAVALGVSITASDVIVLVDSDTVWTPTTLSELVKPFADPKVGGVTTRQRILSPSRSVLTRWADWLENIRNQYSMPAMSVLGTVGCLPGRTIAFRRVILTDCMDRFLSERFLGVFLEVSDDRALTNLTLRAGYDTVYQSTSLVHTDAPTRLRTLIRQQYRWARGSQYNTLRMLPWMLRRTPVLATFYLADIITPFILVGSGLAWIVSGALGFDVALYEQLPLPAEAWQSLLFVFALSVAMTVISLAVRFGYHFAYRPADLLFLPAFMLLNTLVLMPVRVVGFLRMAHDAGWGTRRDAFAGRRRPSNPQVAVPYLLGIVMLGLSVMISV